MIDDTQWIEWGGGDCPVPHGTKLDLRLHGVSKNIECDDPEDWSWEHGDNGLRLTDITHYRLRKPPVDWKGIAEELAAAINGLIEWDKQRKHIVVYRVRDPLLKAITHYREAIK